MQAKKMIHMERELLRAGERARRSFERDVLNTVGRITRASTFSMAGVGKQRNTERLFTPLVDAMRMAFGLAGSVGQRFAGAMAATASFPKVVRYHLSNLSPGVRALIGTVALSGVCVAATAAGLVVKGYVDNPVSSWKAILKERTVSPVYDKENTLIGAVDTQGKLAAAKAYDFAYIPLVGSVPETYQAGLLHLENRHLQKGGIHNICGIDLTSFARVFTGAGGGSGLGQQLTLNLKMPDWERGHGVSRAVRWFMQVGATCSLYKALGGDVDALIATYSSYAPMYQGRGSLRGLQSTSKVVWDVVPSNLSDAQQLVLAAAVKKPLRIVPNEDRAVLCEAVYPWKNNPTYNAEIAKKHGARTTECEVINRAVRAAKGVLAGVRLADALQELRGYQLDGINPVNPFEYIGTDKVVNLSARAVSTMPEGLLKQIKQEAIRADHEPGEPLKIAMDAVQQNEFSDAVKADLERIQQSPQGRSLLCMPLIGTPKKPLTKVCRGAIANTMADVLAVKVNVSSGAIKRMYANNPLLLNQRQSVGSLAKLVIATAAVADGYEADSMWCPKKVQDQQRSLRRVTAPVNGFDDCVKGKNAISLLQATAESDNLVFYQLALALGNDKLLRAAKALGFTVQSEKNIAYALAFGSFGATATEIMTAGQQLFATAYNVPIKGQAPVILAGTPQQPKKQAGGASRLIPNSAQRSALRQLLEAPVQQGGTLAFMSATVDSGKTGTVQSAVTDVNGNNYAHAKWALSYSANRGELNLFMVSSPLPSIPFARHQVQGSLFKSTQNLLTQP